MDFSKASKFKKDYNTSLVKRCIINQYLCQSRWPLSPRSPLSLYPDPSWCLCCPQSLLPPPFLSLFHPPPPPPPLFFEYHGWRIGGRPMPASLTWTLRQNDWEKLQGNTWIKSLSSVVYLLLNSASHSARNFFWSSVSSPSIICSGKNVKKVSNKHF